MLVHFAVEQHSLLAFCCFRKRFQNMDRLDSSGSDLDLDIDLESGGTSEEDASKGHVLRGENLKNMMGKINIEFLRVESPHGSTNSSDCSCSYEKLLNSDGISIKNKETKLGKFRKEMVNFVDKTMGRSNKQTSAKPPKPPRPPRGPSLDASDMKLLKEISELNLKRKRMERIRTLRKMKKEKASSLTSNLFALLVTIIFLLVIVFQGLLGSRL